MPKAKTTGQVAKQLGISLRHLYRLLHTGAIPEPRHKRVGAAGIVRMWTARDIQRAKRALKHPTRGSRPLIEEIIKRVRPQGADAKASKASRFVARGPMFTDAKPSTFTMHYDPNEPLIDTDELARRLSVKPTWVREQLRKRAKIRSHGRPLLPHVKVGKHTRFAWKDVCNWLDQMAKIG
ncbi:MAG TPA: hypothetical protein VJN69_14495 [Candidatus Acidoferrales bacterium]|nr:hypothetical protein [Candidatus Acidoferrales bacterium]